MKTLSIIIPCYNVEDSIQKCLDSLYAQTLPLNELEIIAVDDTSTDHTYEILKENEKKHPDILQIIHFDSNEGVSVSRNIGLQRAQGEYIGFVDGDDFVDIDMFERMIACANKYHADFVACKGSDITKHDANEIKVSKMQRGRQQEETYLSLVEEEVRRDFLIFSDCSTRSWDKIYRLSFLKQHEIAFPSGIIGEDIYFCYLVYAFATNCCMMQETFYYHVIDENTQNSIYQNRQLERIHSMERLYHELISREMFLSYYKEWEMIYIRKYYSDVMHLMTMEFDAISDSVYAHIGSFMDTVFPNASANPYLQNEAFEIEQFYMQTMHWTKEDLDEFEQMVREARGG